MMPKKNRFPVVRAERRGSGSFLQPTATTTETAQIAESISATAAVLGLLRTTGMSTASDEECLRHGDLRRLTPIECERIARADTVLWGRRE